MSTLRAGEHSKKRGTANGNPADGLPFRQLFLEEAAAEDYYTVVQGTGASVELPDAAGASRGRLVGQLEGRLLALQVQFHNPDLPPEVLERAVADLLTLSMYVSSEASVVEGRDRARARYEARSNRRIKRLGGFE